MSSKGTKAAKCDPWLTMLAARVRGDLQEGRKRRANDSKTGLLVNGNHEKKWRRRRLKSCPAQAGMHGGQI